MKNILRKSWTVAMWGACVFLFPYMLMGIFFMKIYAALALGIFLFIKIVMPRIIRRPGKPSLLTAVFVAEFTIAVLAMAYYASDRREKECVFPLDDRVVPIITYGQCLSQYSGTRRNACLAIVHDPYDIALYRGDLLVVSGRDYTTLGRIPLDKPESFNAWNLGYGNIQQIIVDEKKGRAVMPMWKKREILLYDLEKSAPIGIVNTDVSKLIAAEEYGKKVYIVSEIPWLFVFDLEKDTLKRRALGYRFHTLGDVKASPARRAIYMSDWVWGLVYKLDMDTMKTVRQRFPGIVSTGLTLDDRACELYVSRLVNSKIDVMDCETLKTKREIPAGFGAHETALSRNGDRLYAVRYFAGKFREIDLKTGKTISEVDIGGQTRALLYLKKENRLFVGTKCGIYEIKL